jgi:hypothetical protein
MGHPAILATPSSNTPDFWTGTPGDLNHPHGINIADLVYLVNWIFHQRPDPYPIVVGDVTGNCSVHIANLVHLVNIIFRQGPEPGIGCEGIRQTIDHSKRLVYYSKVDGGTGF